MSLSFVAGDAATTVPLKTKDYGTVHFYLGQLLRTEPDGKKQHRLTTRAYWYRLQSDPDLRAQAAIRWEYERELDGGKQHCRHHIQQRTHVNFGGQRLDLNKAHVPTGYVTIEEVIRFLIVDLGVKPPCGAAWETHLSKSERQFYEEFSGKRYHAPT